MLILTVVSWSCNVTSNRIQSMKDFANRPHRYSSECCRLSFISQTRPLLSAFPLFQRPLSIPHLPLSRSNSQLCSHWPLDLSKSGNYLRLGPVDCHFWYIPIGTLPIKALHIFPTILMNYFGKLVRVWIRSTFFFLLSRRWFLQESCRN